MATAQQSPVKSAPTPQYESFVEQELARARRRLLGFDAAAWGLLLGCVVLAYGLSMSLADLLLDLPTSIRVVCWGVFMAALIVGAVVAARRLLTSVNPHFLARQLEHTVPDAKNSIINWLDLRAEPLAPVIRGSLGRRAAKDLSHADTEQAISGKSLWWLGGVAGVLLLLQIGWLIAAPGQVWSLLQRAFLPFDGSRIALRTTLTLKEPDGGNVAVPANQPVVFRVQAEGYVPPLNHKDALKLHFRYHQNEIAEERSLLCDADGIWTTTVHADQVRGGFWYKITGGDAQLPEVGEYRLDVHAAPQVLRFEAAFKYRDYLKTKDKKVVFDKNVRPSIKEMRGTEVTLTVRTNRVLEECVLELKQGGAKLDLAGEPVPGDPEAWRFKWLLDQGGEFRILFKSKKGLKAKEGEENVDRQACKIEVIPDLAPEVEMTKPAQDLSLPANGTLVVDGYATDDFGVKSMQLRLKVLKAVGPMPDLKAKRYRPDISFELVDGTYPFKLEYSDFLALDKIQTSAGELFPLAAGMELEYWLEARDNCDYPTKDGNLGQSTRYKLTITPPETDKKKADQDRQATEKAVGQNQQKQDGDLKDQNSLADAKSKASGGAGSAGANNPQDELNKQAQDVQKAIADANNKGEAKPGDQPNGEAKEKGPQDGKGGDAKGGDPQPKDGPDDGKDPGDQSMDNKAGASKGSKSGSGDQPKSAAGDGKGPGDAAAGQPPPGEKKDGKGDAAKSGPKGGPNNDAAAKGKGSPDADPKMDLGQQKGGGDPDPKNLASAPPGQTKGAELADNAGPKKGPGTVEQASGAKGARPTNEPPPPGTTPPPGATPGPPDPSQASSGKAGDRKDSKLEDVAKLRDQLEDPGQREAANKALEKIAEQAADPKVQDAAQKLLDQNQAKPGQAKAGGPQGTPPPITADAKTPGDPQKAGDPGKAVAKNAQDKAEAGATKEASGQSNKAGTAKNDPTKPGSSTGTAAQNAANHDNAGSPNPVDEAAARRAADLQLESLKKQVDKLREKFTPDVMKKLDWTPKEREDFLQKMLADALLRQQQQKTTGDKLPMPGSIQSPLPSSGPQLLQNLGGGGGPVIIENPEPPPGVREAMNAFKNKK